MQKDFLVQPSRVIDTESHSIHYFDNESGDNIDVEVVNTFGEEWSKFHSFKEEDLDKAGKNYFRLLTDEMCNKDTYGIDLGCGTGRWTKYLSSRIGFMECLDPSEAIYAAKHVLSKVSNVRLIKASIDNIPFPDNTFDFAMSVGVLHHIPDTQLAMKSCVTKVKKGGYFYAYLYYNMEDRGPLFKLVFAISDLIRKIVSHLPSVLKKVICDIIALLIYFPLVSISRLLTKLGFSKLGRKIPLSSYSDKSFYIMRNDALDRFGTKLEQRFSREEIKTMMKNAGLDNIVVSDKKPYYTAIGQKK